MPRETHLLLNILQGDSEQKSLDIVIIYILEIANMSRPEFYWYFCV